MMKENKCQLRILYPAKLTFRKDFLRLKKKKSKEFLTTRFALQEMLKKILTAEMKGQ